MPEQHQRAAIWKQLGARPSSGQPWDVVIVGGGITGAGILLQAAQQGLRAVLVEAKDFAYGTSSRSTKLVHGGLRYLRQRQFRLTRKALRERERLMREAPGLVDDLGFTIASLPGDVTPKWMFGVGLAMYDALAGRWHHQKLSRNELLARHPVLANAGVIGGYRYHDAQTDDARLVLRVLDEAVRAGGIAVNYAHVDGLLRSEAGRVCGVLVRDTAPGPQSGQTAELLAKVTINATGAWADELRVKAGATPRMRKIRGSHLTFSRDRLPLTEALCLFHPDDGRAVFAVPWEGVTIFGTTDQDHSPSMAVEPRISDEEVEYLLRAVHRSFPSQELSHTDIIGTWAGVRPVINTGKQDPSKESREHAIWQENGLLTVAGGKLTTFAVMARDTLRAVAPVLGPQGRRQPIFTDPPQPITWPSTIPEPLQARLLGRYGHGCAALATGDPSLWTPVGKTPVTWAELVYAAQHESVVHLEDLLLRRVRLGCLVPHGGREFLPRIRELVAPSLGWDDARWTAELAAYAALWSHAYAGR